jgi:hypothetical protein
MYINEKYDYSTDCSFGSQCEYQNQMSLKAVLLHETGHCLGLGDIRDVACIDDAMYYQIPFGTDARDNLTLDDAAAINQLYYSGTAVLNTFHAAGGYNVDTLTWHESSPSSGFSYSISQSIDCWGPFDHLIDVPMGQTDYSVTVPVSCYGHYYYRLVAPRSGETVFADAWPVTAPGCVALQKPVLATPTIQSIGANAATVRLDWTGSWPAGTSFAVYRALNGTTVSCGASGGPWLASVTGTQSYTDTDVPLGVRVDYRVRAYDASGRFSDVSDDVSECIGPFVNTGKTDVVLCPGGDMDTVLVAVQYAGYCVGQLGSPVFLVRTDSAPVLLWDGTGKTIAVGDTLAGIPIAPGGQYVMRATRGSGCGSVAFDFHVGAAVPRAGITFSVRSPDVNMHVVGVVDRIDAAEEVSHSFGSYSACFDLNGDGVVDGRDVVLLASHEPHHVPKAGVLSPLGGASFTYWATVNSRWEPFAGDSALTTLWLYREGYQPGKYQIATNVPDSGSYAWNAASIWGGGSGYHFIVEHTAGVRVSDGSNVFASDTSSSFAIDQAPGGGCPTVETLAGGNWAMENTILGRSPTVSLGLDSYRLKAFADTTAGTVQLRIRENEREYTTLDQVRLVAVDHPGDSRAFGIGNRVVLGTASPFGSVVKSTGEDVTSVLYGGGYTGQPGDTLIAQMAPLMSARAERITTGGDGGDVIDDGGGKSPQPAAYRLRHAGPASSSNLDDLVLDSTGLLVQGPDGQGGWTTLEHYYPRERPDEAVVDSVGYSRMRLIFIGQHKLNYIGHILPSGESFKASKLTLLSAQHTRLGDVLPAVNSAGNLTTYLQPGDTLNLSFAYAPLDSGMTRDYFLLANGAYTSNLPANPGPAPRDVPTSFALEQNRPNPFAVRTTIGFALPRASDALIEVFDLAGRRLQTLARGTLDAGYHSVDWDRRDGGGNLVGPGIYLYRLIAGSFRDQKKMVLLP